MFSLEMEALQHQFGGFSTLFKSFLVTSRDALV